MDGLKFIALILDYINLDDDACHGSPRLAAAAETKDLLHWMLW